MKEQLISFKTAKLAKEKGFNITNRNSYDENTGLMLPLDPHGHCYTLEGVCPAPTQSLLQKWLREEHNIHIKVDDFIDDETGIEWDYEIVIIGTDLDERGNYIPLISYDIERKFKTYEEALELGLEEALNLI